MDRRSLRPSPHTLAVGAAAGAAAGAAIAGLAWQRHYQRALAGTPEYARLTAPLGGRPMIIRSADGTALHAEVFGPEDGDTIVLAHGWTEQLTMWGPVIGRLADLGLRSVAFDLRGHGASGPAADHDYSLARFGEDLEAVLARATEDGDGRRAIVVGHSLGGMSIAAWAEHHDVGARARAAALVNTGLGDLGAGHLLFGRRAKGHHPLASRAFLSSRAPLPPFSTPLSQAAIRYVAFGPEASVAEIAFYERMLIACPSDVRAACGLALSQMDLWRALAQLTVPTLVIAGDRDKLTPPAHAERIARELPRLTELVVLPRTGHMSPLERPDAVATALSRLAAGAPARAASVDQPQAP